MTTPVLRFENNERAAHAVSHYLDSLRPSPQRFTVRPYNRFDSAFTAWWLVPSTDWPAYRHGKLAFHQCDNARQLGEYMQVGYYVEHGYGQHAVGGMTAKSHIMTSDWYWHRFVGAAAAGELEPIVAEVAQRSGRPVVASVDMWAVNHPPAFDEEPVAPDDWYETVITPGDGGVKESWRDGGRLLRSLRGTTSVAGLAQGIGRLEGLDFFWINLTIGVRLRYGDGDTGNWGAADLWHNVLAPWNPWVR